MGFTIDVVGANRGNTGPSLDDVLTGDDEPVLVGGGTSVENLTLGDDSDICALRIEVARNVDGMGDNPAPSSESCASVLLS